MTDVLIVDDDAAVRVMMQVILEENGFTVESVADARTALRRLRDAPPRLVVTDLYMPDMNGLELLGVARQVAPGLPVLVISGGGPYSATTPLAAAERMGAVSTLEKPFGAQELVTAVREALDSL